ncbi:MAG: hypothetical protein RLY93_08000 [Sumerlaeia bacterium]
MRPSLPFPRLLLFFLGCTLLSNGWVFVLTCHIVGHWFLPLDDAFIYVQYAERIADLRPFSYRPGGGFSTGATSPLYPFLLAPFALVLRPEAMVWPLLAFSVLWKVLTALGVYRAAWAMTRQPGPGLVAGLIVCFHGVITFGMMNGMETGLLAASAAWSLVLAMEALRRPERPLSTGRMLVVAAVFAVLSLCRPEAAFVPAALFVASFFLRVPKGFRAAIGLSLLPGVLYVALVVLMSGRLGTSTSAAKLLTVHPFQSRLETLTHAAYSLDRMGRLRIGGLLAFPPFAILGALLALVANRRARPGWLPLLWLVPLLAPFLSVDPILHDGRYFAGWLPILFLLWTVGAWTLVGWIGRKFRRAAWLVLAAAGLLPGLISLPAKSQEFSHLANEMGRMHKPAADWLRENVRRGEIVGIHDAGILAALSDQLVVDFNGLVTADLTGLAGSGPGSLWEGLERRPFAEYPQWIASFPAFTHSAMTAQAMTEFPLEDNIWGAGTPLVIWSMKLPWLTRAMDPAAPPAEAWELVDWIDHGDRESEEAHGYKSWFLSPWRKTDPALLRELPLSPDSSFRIMDGGRRSTDFEEFTLVRNPNAEALLVLRVWSDEEAALLIGWPGGSAEVPLAKAAGSFQEVAVPIPAGGGGAELRFRIQPVRGEMPVPEAMEVYHGWLYQPAGSLPEATSRLAAAEAGASERFLFGERGYLKYHDDFYGSWLPLDERFALIWHEGWDSNLSYGKANPYRWILGTRVGLGLPIRELTGEEVVVRLHGRAMGDAEGALPNRVTPVVGGVRLDPVDFGPESEQTVTLRIPAERLQPGINPLVLEFENSYSVQLLDPGSKDDRQLVMAVFGVQVFGAGFREE